MWRVACACARVRADIQQVEKICETIGAPRDEDMTHITHTKARPAAAPRARAAPRRAAASLLSRRVHTCTTRLGLGALARLAPGMAWHGMA